MKKEKKAYNVEIGKNGKKFVTLESVSEVFHATDGNSKTGHCGNYNLPIEYTCRHDCNCYKDGACYACQGFYQYGNNQALYSENLNYYKKNESNIVVESLTKYIIENKLEKFRYFTIGDIPDARFFSDIMIATAIKNPNVKFWAYTKKYSIVNKYCDENGVESVPENLVIIFSHWLNDDGTYFPMDNKYNFPTSEFIPLGREELTETVTHICPCSDPNVKVTCETCDHPCYTLKHGESMALLEHSTKRTKARDKAIREAKKAL